MPVQACLALLFEQAGNPEDWRQTLLASPAVSGGDTQTPMILVGERLYLNRLWRNELTGGAFFAERQSQPEVDEARLTQVLETLFTSDDGRQKLAESGGSRGANATDLGDFWRSGHRENDHRGKTACRADSDRASKSAVFAWRPPPVKRRRV